MLPAVRQLLSQTVSACHALFLPFCFHSISDFPLNVSCAFIHPHFSISTSYDFQEPFPSTPSILSSSYHLCMSRTLEVFLAMDPEKTILKTAREKVGCNGLRNYTDLGKLRQDTLERRFHAAQGILSMGNMGSVYAMWLQDQLNRIGGADRTKVVRAFCTFLASWGFGEEQAVELWNDCMPYACSFVLPNEWPSFLEKMEAVREDLRWEFPALRTRPDPRVSTNSAILRPKDGNKPQTSKPIPFQPAQQMMKSKPPTSPIRKSKPLDLNPYSSHTAQQRTRGKTPTSPSRRKNNDLFTIDLTKDKWDKPVKVDFVKGSGHDEAVLKVPKNYVCKRCGVKGW